jgi:hypothetical protein
MKFLIALATTVALVGPAHAAELPKADPLIGEWCWVKGETRDVPIFYSRKTSDDECEDKLTIERGHSSNRSAECSFDKVERSRRGRYVVHVDCDHIIGRAFSFKQRETLRIVEGMLRIRVHHREGYGALK